MTTPDKHILVLVLALVSVADGFAREDLSRIQADSVRTLLARKAALELELDLVRADGEAYYLIVDAIAGEVRLKSGARLLRTCPIAKGRVMRELGRQCRLLTMANRIDPFTPEPGNDGLRLRGRRMPLDFIGRLIEGPREASSLYFVPSLLLQPADLPPPDEISYLQLSGHDIKALGSALSPGSRAVLVPPVGAEPDSGAVR